MHLCDTVHCRILLLTTTCRQVPTDMLMGVHDCMRMIHQTAREVLVRGAESSGSVTLLLWTHVGFREGISVQTISFRCGSTSQFMRICSTCTGILHSCKTSPLPMRACHAWDTVSQRLLVRTLPTADHFSARLPDCELMALQRR